MKKIVLFFALSTFYNYTFGQQCFKPEPLSTSQIQKITGTWKMKYTLNDKSYESQVNIKKVGSDQVTCELSRPPINQKETASE